MDDPGGSTYPLLIIFILLSLSALYSGAETALFSLTPVRLRQLQENGHRQAPLLQQLLANGPRLLSTILISNNVVNIWFTSIVTRSVHEIAGFVVGTQLIGVIATAITTVLLLVIGEVTPKAIAASIPERFSASVAKPIALTMGLFSPVLVIFGWLSRVFGLSNHEIVPTITEEAIKTAATIGEATGALGQDEREMIYGILDSADQTIDKVMVQRAMMVAVSQSTQISEVVEILRQRGFSRLPVYRRDLDDIVGLVYAKDIIQADSSQTPFILSDIVRPVLRCRSTRKVASLLKEMRLKRSHLAIVTDEQGRTLGLVTMEDLLEEIVGEIIDEYDNEATPLKEAVSCLN